MPGSVYVFKIKRTKIEDVTPVGVGAAESYSEKTFQEHIFPPKVDIYRSVLEIYAFYPVYALGGYRARSGTFKNFCVMGWNGHELTCFYQVLQVVPRCLRAGKIETHDEKHQLQKLKQFYIHHILFLRVREK